MFDEAEDLFATRTNEGGSTSRHDSMNVGILLHHMEEFSGIVVAITNRYAQVDTAFHRRFKFIMEFPTPDAATRSKLWRMLIPAAAPLAKDVNFDELGQRFEISGGHIKSGARSSTYTRIHSSQRIASPPHYTWPMRTTVTADGSPLAEWLRAQTERLASGGLLFTHTHNAHTTLLP